ncbi:hypothetical protein ScPMuIL_008354 [Solemya velum]
MFAHQFDVLQVELCCPAAAVCDLATASTSRDAQFPSTPTKFEDKMKPIHNEEVRAACTYHLCQESLHHREFGRGHHCREEYNDDDVISFGSSVNLFSDINKAQAPGTPPLLLPLAPGGRRRKRKTKRRAEKGDDVSEAEACDGIEGNQPMHSRMNHSLGMSSQMQPVGIGNQM